MFFNLNRLSTAAKNLPWERSTLSIIVLRVLSGFHSPALLSGLVHIGKIRGHCHNSSRWQSLPGDLASGLWPA